MNSKKRKYLIIASLAVILVAITTIFLVNKTLKNKIKVEETLGMENPYHYRNKLQFPVGIDKNGDPIIGVFAN